jgi:ABC-type transport system involved in cytochrome bd biosynthesis fused ATPase/permease subunit
MAATVGEDIAYAAVPALVVIAIAGALIRRSKGTDGARPATSSEDVEVTRSKTGLLALVAGDVVIISLAVMAAYKVTGAAQPAIISAAFSAVTAITAAFFGIRAASNTAAKAIEKMEELQEPKSPKDELQEPKSPPS